MHRYDSTQAVPAKLTEQQSDCDFDLACFSLCYLPPFPKIGVELCVLLNEESVLENHAKVCLGRKFFDWQNYEIPALNTLVCLDCGKDLPYDWDAMRVIREEKKTAF